MRRSILLVRPWTVFTHHSCFPEPRPVNFIVERIQTQEVLTSTNSVCDHYLYAHFINNSCRFRQLRSILKHQCGKPNPLDILWGSINDLFRESLLIVKMWLPSVFRAFIALNLPESKKCRLLELSQQKRNALLRNLGKSTPVYSARAISNNYIFYPEPRHCVAIDERRLDCAPIETEELESDEEIEVVDTPTVARTCIERSRSVSSSPIQAQSFPEFHSDAGSPNSEAQLHELSDYLSHSPTITTADVEIALRNVNSESHLSAIIILPYSA